MNAPKLKPAVLLLSFAALVATLVVQRQRLHAARLEHADLLIAASKAPAQPDAASRIPERAELDQLRREHDEMVRLRAKRDEMNRKEADFRAMVIPPPPVPVPEGTVKPLSVSLALADVPAADRSTPIGALHQLIWATQRGDGQWLDRLRAPGTPPEVDDGSDLDPASPLHEEIRNNKAAALLRNQDALEGATTVNLTQQRELLDGRIALTFGFEWEDGRAKGRLLGGETRLRKVDGQWFVESLQLKPHEFSL